MLERWAAFLGEPESRALALANNEAPQQAFRVNTLRTSGDDAIGWLEGRGVITRPSERVPGAFVAELVTRVGAGAAPCDRLRCER